MNNKLIPLVITLVVGIILAGSVLMPVLNDATKTTGTISNDGYFRMQKITDEDETVYTLTWDRTSDKVLLNGTEIEMSGKSTYSSLGGVSIAMTDNSVSRYVPALRIQTWISGVGGSMGYSSTTMEIEFNQGTLTITADEGLETEAVKTTTYEYAYFASNTGNYVMKDKDQKAAVFADSEIYAMGVTNINNSTAPGTPILSVLKMTGDASSVEFSAIYGLSGTPTFSDVEIIKTENSKYVGVYDLDKVTATVTYDSADTAITYSYFVVPYQVTAELSEHLSAGEIALMNAIPVMVIVALLMAAVGAIFIRNRD